MTLEAFFAASRSSGFKWGERDCLTWPASWAVARGHADPARLFRGSYTTSAEARRIVRLYGGVLMLARDGCRAADLPEIDPASASSGDLGVGVMDGETDWGRSPMGLICAGAFWAALSPLGVILGRAEMLAAWKV